MCSDSESDDTSNGETGHPLRPTDLDEGEVWIEYHPASGKLPEKLSAADKPVAVALPRLPFNTNVPPWHPFASRADFEQAEIFLRFDASDTHIDSQLKHMSSVCPLGHSVTLKSARELHDLLARVPNFEVIGEVSKMN